jgi:long-chain fatty acid transport protein
MGTASAGRAASGSDASAASGNPASMTLLDRSQSLTTLQILYIESRFDTDFASFGGGDGGNAGGVVPAGSLHYVYVLDQDWRFGISAGSYMGLGLDYGDDWAGRYYVTEAELMTFGVNPGVGYRVNEWFSAGAGVSLIAASLDQKAAINNAAVPGQAGLRDGSMELEDSDVSYGFNAGALFEVSEATRVGITYRSEVDIEFEDVMELKNIGPVLRAALFSSGLARSKADLDMTLPQAVMVSGYHQLNPEWALVANIGWQDWNEFGKQELSLSGSDSTTYSTDLDYDETWHFALGAQYRFAPEWLWSVGTAYDTSPVDGARNRTPDLPFDRQIRIGTGIQYDINEDITVGGAYEYLDLGSARIKQDGGPLQGDLYGEYEDNRIHFFAFNLIWRY